MKEAIDKHLEVFELLRNDGYSRDEFLDWMIVHCKVDNPLEEDDLSNFAQDFKDYRESLKTLEIDDANFDQYFFDVRRNRPKPGQVLACYVSKADFVDSNIKRDIINLLSNNDKGGSSAVALLEKLSGATKKSAIATVKSMTNDLLSGLSVDEVASKPYDMQCEFYFYTYKECIPENDSHWWSASLIDVTRNKKRDLDSQDALPD